MYNTRNQRSFATQKKKKHNNKGGNKPQDVYKQQIKAQQQQSSIIGKRPGQTSFSPPTEKIVLEASTTTQSLSTPSKTKSTSEKCHHKH